MICIIIHFSDATFIIANAQVDQYPIIYCSEDFSDEMGYPRSEVTQHNVYIDFIRGYQTSEDHFKSYAEAIENSQKIQVEMVLYSKWGELFGSYSSSSSVLSSGSTPDLKKNSYTYSINKHQLKIKFLKFKNFHPLTKTLNHAHNQSKIQRC